ncbi:transposase IS200 like family protein [Lyngbya aestuarii BL J]|uniref:Transposase IS200 like family protein n=1 Tax=Lyngbya aestuarii BL J TaxID=1348334 RepID=U7QHZ4_9CYAN|nr:transposase IS200 like family protein [Lyngbya aestuarii BL J]
MGKQQIVHIVVIEYPPKLSVSTIVNHLKGVSSRMYGKAGYKKLNGTALGRPSYFSSSVGGAPLNVLKEYVANQRTPK